jgi:kynurenine formamidase
MIFPYQLIDLTHTLQADIPTWEGGCGFHHELQSDYSDCDKADSFRVMKIKLEAGIGTHMDAPSHCIPGGLSIHHFDVSELCMPCAVIDITAHCFPSYSLTLQDVVSFENRYGPLIEGSCVMIKTGWSQFWGNREQYHHQHVFPSVSIEAADFLLERGVKALGIDTLSPDRPQEGFKVHRAFLGRGRILIENVAYLERMPPVGAFVMVMPMKIRDGTEAPIRLIGLIKKG